MPPGKPPTPSRHAQARSKTWKKKALRIVGVYRDKAAAVEKQRQMMDSHTCCGHGDIIVGDTWEDEIDLVVRPVEEMALELAP